jgi:hypothetical protein
MIDRTDIATRDGYNVGPFQRTSGETYAVCDMVCFNASGDIVPASDTVGLTRVFGIVTGISDDGIIVTRNKAFLLKNSSSSPVTKTELTKNCYCVDSVTVAKTTNNSIVAGIVLQIDTDGVWIEI